MRSITRASAVLRRRFIYDGILGGNRKWLILGGLAFGAHHLRRTVGTSAVQAVYTEDLLPGEKLMITHAARPQKRRR
jgi:hypothetical protein